MAVSPVGMQRRTLEDVEGTEYRRKGVSAGASVCNDPPRFKAWDRA